MNFLYKDRAENEDIEREIERLHKRLEENKRRQRSEKNEEMKQ